MPKVTIRYQLIKDARRFFEILNNPNFIYFPTSVNSVAEEKKILKENAQKRKDNISWNYSILYGNQLVGGIGVRINRTRPYAGEIGYFVDEKYWGKGISTQAVKLAEQEGFKKLGLNRIEIIMRPENKASEKVAIKNGYKKEGRMKKAIKDKNGMMRDALLYAKTL
ncbi:MAG: GNAT family protein [Patescibacteria group bacterium]|jgi:ribosomal-protein-alanine N-acetyltransferase